MGVGRRKLAPLWALALALACAQHTGHAQGGSSESSYGSYLDLPAIPQGPSGDSLRGVTVVPPLRAIPVVRAPDPVHNGRVCSTWGDFHYKTFDGAVFRFPGLCNYVFSAHCGGAYEDFNVQLRRSRQDGAVAPSRVIMKLEGLVVELTSHSVLVSGRPVQLPFSQAGVLIERSSSSLKVVAKLGLVFMWNQDDSLLLELDSKFANQTCGLCGDFNGIPASSEFLSHNTRLTPVEFGNLQKLDGPMEQCQDPAPENKRNCSTAPGVCEEVLGGELFSSCAELVDVNSYVEACRQDLCLCDSAHHASCICQTLAEYARQCAHAGGLPLDWRGPDLCPLTCPHDMEYHECRSPCADTCSNPERSQLCEDHCVAGCFCPEGTVLDDIGQAGCVPVTQCACTYNGATYASGAKYSTDCTECTCSGGRWSCQDIPCPGTCSVLGGAHFSTFDERQYTVHGDCSYVLAKSCNSSTFTVLAELRRCGLTDSETCLKSVTLNLDGGQTVVVVKASGEVFVNHIYTQLPVSAANVTIFRPSTFFIIAHSNLGLQLDIQLVPTMQVAVRLEPEFRGRTCGLCGNFNRVQADDFRAISGVVEGTAAAFFNTFKTHASCPNVKNNFEDPCSLSVENEKFAQHWCSRLTDAQGPFAQCHSAVSPGTYHSNCLFDTCNCEKSEDCLCAALASYVRACAAKGVLLRGWRDGVCTKHTSSCPKSMTYHYHISTCQPTCRARSEPDLTCGVSFVPVDGCACPEGTFLDDVGKCVEATSCPCYHGGSVVPNGESVHDSGTVCTCTQGTLTCIGGPAPAPVCDAPMVFFDCRNATAGATGAGCQKSCHTLDMECYSSQCVPGCVCPDGLVADGLGGCIAEEECPCVHNEASYGPGETIWTGCNTCICENRKWRCSDEPCLATCAVYGDGHYLTFDGRRYSFSGDCEYTLLQDQCGGNVSAQDAFRVVTENVPCGTTGTTCSKAIKIFLGSYELKLSDGKVEVVEKGKGQEPPYSIRQMGIFLVLDTDAGLVLLWDRRTSLFLRLSPEFKGRVCGLCGNFDDNAMNDFTTRSQSVVGDALEFGNSWKFSPSCPDAPAPRDSCAANPYRKSWAQKQCSIVHSATFAACHAHVEPAEYYEACVQDACACDSGGDCECFCTAVAAYAQACHEVGVCVSWRSPDVCPLFCDFYNPEGQCEWHYQPCGAPCMRTCRNPSGECLHNVPGLEGCYPKCPSTAPIFDEDEMKCVATCPLPPPAPRCHVHGKSYRPGATVPSDENCHSCVCTESGVRCAYDAEACICTYHGRHYKPGTVIYHTTDGTGGCISARCGANGTIDRTVSPCSPTTAVPPTTFSFSTTPSVVSSTRAPSSSPSPAQSTAPAGRPSTTVSAATSRSPRTVPSTAPTPAPTDCGEQCLWSPWLDVSRPGRGSDSGDYDTLDNLRAHGYRVCQQPREVECRAEDAPAVALSLLGQRVQCTPAVGLTCHNREQASGQCHNYQIRILCCSPLACHTSSLTVHPTTSSTTHTGLSPTPVTATGRVTASEATTTPAPGTPSLSQTTAVTPSPTTGPTTAGTTPSRSSPTLETSATPSEPAPHEPSRVSCMQEICNWTQWIDGSYPGPGRDSGDFDTFQNLRAKGYKFCKTPSNVQCRAQFFPNTPLAELGQDVTCNREEGLICLNKNQLPPICYNYEIRIQCCQVVDSCRGGTTVPPTSETTQPTRPETSSSAQTAMTRAVPSPTTRHTAPTANTQAIGSRTTTRHHTGTTPGTTTTTLATTTHPTSTSRTSTSSTETRSPISGTPKGTTSTSTTSSTSTSRTRTTSKGTGSSTSLTHTGTTPAPTTTTSATTTHPTSTSRTSTSSTETGRSTSTTHPRTRTSSSPTTSSTPVPITGTTSVPTTSTSHPGTQEMTHSQPTTPDCQPRCSWTKWFDVDFPAPGVHGGDKETYDNILRSGERICRRPEEITRLQCRAENHPDVTIEQLGQVVQCDPDVGLVCQNRDQDGAGRMCLNYEVRVLCCETPSSCPTTPPLVTSSPMTPSTAPSTLAPSTALVHGSSQTTTPCFCFVAEKLYPAGAVIYHQRDLEGHCYHATCNPDCQVVRRVDSDCPPTTPPAIQTTPPSTSTSQPVTPSGCSNTIPPRKKGETWPMPNCSQATCEGHDTISVHPRQCPEVSEPTCANGYPPQKEVDQDGCCYHYQCQCVCSGWGDPHYITFDGTYYTFLDNCTYVLMQQIVPVFGHLRVLIDNYFCDAEDGLSCPQSIIVEYGHDRVVMTRRPVAGVMTNQVIFNGKVVGPGFEKDGIVISRLGIKMYVTIPKLGVQVMFTGLIFSVEVPFNKFANNTEGQCGTCTNDKKDECRLPGGKVAASCSAMSHHWKVTNPDQPSCSGSPGSPTDPTTMSPTEPATTCPQSAICELILSEVFEPCHSTIPPLPFYEGCAFDHCHVSSPDVVCSGLELYASLCAAFDVCIDWRGLTNGTCSFTCPPDKVYLPCGPSNPPYCYGNDSANLLTLPEAGPITEGCFCPESTLLFSTSVEVCVPTGCPRCMGPSGEPVMPGDTISFACQECTCEGSSMTMACRAKTCPPAPACELSGFVSVPLAPAAGECCPQYTCACNASYCPKPVDCPAGAHMTLLQEGGACCPIQKCRWTQCNVNGTLYEPGAVVSSTLCETCRCELPDSPEVFKVTCETQICPTHCPVGYAYQAQDGQCCGQCVQVACVSNSSSGSTHLYSPGESWPDPEERCVTHECERHLDGLVVVTTRKACPPLSCPRDQAQLSEDGCCLFCPPPPSQNMSTCAVHHRLQVIREQGCSSTEPVRLAYCRGNCGDTGSMYSLAANTVEHRCSCCQELRTSQRKLSLRCADGSRRDFNYTQVEECGCQGQRCPAPADAGHPGPSESPQWSPRPVH